MSFLIVSCAAHTPRDTCEVRIRELLGRFGEVGRIIIADRAADGSHWVAAVEMRSGAAEAAGALSGGAELEGRPLRVRQARPIEVSSLLVGPV